MSVKYIVDFSRMFDFTTTWKWSRDFFSFIFALKMFSPCLVSLQSWHILMNINSLLPENAYLTEDTASFFVFCFFCLGNFWQITDLHWDPSYKLGDDPQLVCASGGGAAADNAGQFGSYVCDSPWHLINSTVFAMKDILPDPDFIIWTGFVPQTNSSTDSHVCLQIF